MMAMISNLRIRLAMDCTNEINTIYSIEELRAFGQVTLLDGDLVSTHHTEIALGEAFGFFEQMRSDLPINWLLSICSIDSPHKFHLKLREIYVLQTKLRYRATA